MWTWTFKPAGEKTRWVHLRSSAIVVKGCGPVVGYCRGDLVQVPASESVCDCSAHSGPAEVDTCLSRLPESMLDLVVLPLLALLLSAVCSLDLGHIRAVHVSPATLAHQDPGYDSVCGASGSSHAHHQGLLGKGGGLGSQ